MTLRMKTNTQDNGNQTVGIALFLTVTLELHYFVFRRVIPSV